MQLNKVFEQLGWFYCVNIVTIIMIVKTKHIAKTKPEKLDYIYKYSLILFITILLIAIITNYFI